MECPAQFRLPLDELGKSGIVSESDAWAALRWGQEILKFHSSTDIQEGGTKWDDDDTV